MGPSIKDVRTKSDKLTPSLLACKMSALAQPPLLPCACGHTINFEKSEFFFIKKCGRPHLKNLPCPKNVRTGQIPSPPDYGRPFLWTFYIFMKSGNRAENRKVPGGIYTRLCVTMKYFDYCIR